MTLLHGVVTLKPQRLLVVLAFAPIAAFSNLVHRCTQLAGQGHQILVEP